MLDRQCYPLKPFFHGLSRYGLIQVEDAECFQIDGEIEWSGIALLIVAALFSQIASHIVLKEASQSIARREKNSQSASRYKRSTEMPSDVGSINMR